MTKHVPFNYRINDAARIMLIEDVFNLSYADAMAVVTGGTDALRKIVEKADLKLKEGEKLSNWHSAMAYELDYRDDVRPAKGNILDNAKAYVKHIA